MLVFFASIATLNWLSHADIAHLTPENKRWLNANKTIITQTIIGINLILLLYFIITYLRTLFHYK
ncbi:MAG: hypothetical protein EAY81_01220 [Bacteroidetes bacterium]|nr:MAG: hypothetical protein EAY81_01220 [Bacteroidota bacterium]